LRKIERVVFVCYESGIRAILENTFVVIVRGVRMRKGVIVVSALLIAVWCCAVPDAASAWELELDGKFEWIYEWYQQRGANGFFGPYNADSGAGTNVANLNFWNGAQFDTPMTTGADAAWSYFTVELLPTIKVTEAIRFRGKLRLGQYLFPRKLEYITEDSPGINTAISDGQWMLFWVTAQTPWGIIGIGKRPWKFGTGLQYDGDDSATTESIVLVAPYGSFDVGIGFHPFRHAGVPYLSTVYHGVAGLALFDPYDLAPLLPVFNRADKGGAFAKDLVGFLRYHSGPMLLGALGYYGSFHIGPEAPLVANQRAAQDSEFFHGTTFVQYNNGRFFFNAEAAAVYWTDRYSDPIGIVGAPNPRHSEQWRYMVELGCLVGPAKFTLLHAMTPGPDRRNGAYIGKQPCLFVWHPNFENTYLSNYTVFRPYAYLFSFDYGSGLQAYNSGGDGYLRDARILAARMDYAVAANLNLSTSCMWAERTSRGYGWGFIGPNTAAAFDGTPKDGNIQLFNRGSGAPGSPNIPDSALGFEIDASVDWKLLEKWTVTIVAGYWQPGKWFNYACIDRSVPGWNVPVAGNFYGTRPDRSVDPIIGGRFIVTFEL
jgi:hypothetical protein